MSRALLKRRDRHRAVSTFRVFDRRVRLKPSITHVLTGIESVPRAFEITANKGRYKAINPAQVMMRGQGTVTGAV